jgi:hypothetical protein
MEELQCTEKTKTNRIDVCVFGKKTTTITVSDNMIVRKDVHLYEQSHFYDKEYFLMYRFAPSLLVMTKENVSIVRLNL